MATPPDATSRWLCDLRQVTKAGVLICKTGVSTVPLCVPQAAADGYHTDVLRTEHVAGVTASLVLLLFITMCVEVQPWVGSLVSGVTGKGYTDKPQHKQAN